MPRLLEDLRREITRNWARAHSVSHSLGTGTGLVLWYGLLLLTIPALSRQWPAFLAEQWPPIKASAPSDFLLSPLGLLYAGLCALVCIAFAWMARRRRVVFLAFAVTVLWLQLTDGTVGWDRLAIATLGLATLTILLEAFRQNIPFFRECHRNQVAVRKLAYRSLILWSPLLIFLFLGVQANQWLVRASAEFVYDTTPIDEYCAALTANGDEVVPCTGMDDLLEPAEVRAFGLQADAEHHIRTMFRARQRALLAALASPDAGVFGDGAAIEPLAIQMAAETRATDILGFGDSPDIQADHAARARRVAAVSRLTDEIRTTDAQINAIRRLNRGPMAATVARSAQVQAVERRRAELERSRQQQQDELEALEKEEAALAEKQIRALRTRLFGILRGLEINPKEIIVRAQGRSEQERRSQVALYMVEAMDRMEDRAIRAISSELRPYAADDDGAPDQDLAYAALGATRSCSAETESPNVVDKEGNPTAINSRRFPCWEIPEAGNPLTRLGLRESAGQSIDDWKDRQESAIHERFRAAVAAGYEGAAGSRDAAIGLADGVDPTIDLGRKKCSLLLIGNCIGNFVKHKTEEGYADAREKIGNEFSNAVSRESGAAAETLAEQLVIARAEASVMLQKSVQLMHQAVDGMHQIGIVLSVLLSFFLVLAIIKSLLYVFSTELFDSREVATIELDRGEAVEGEYVAGSILTLPLDFKQKLITKTVLDNQSLRKTLAPWPFSAPFARIRHGAYFLFNKGSHRPSSQNPMSFSQAEGKAIVDWQMKEGEEVVFDYRNFFGASENVKLRTTISLRLSTLLLGRFVFHSAYCSEGPGRLLLVVNGQVVKDQAAIDSTPLDRLIAFSKHTRFRVDSERTMRSVFMDGYTIVRVREEGQPAGLMLVEAIGSERSLMSGSLRFIKTLLLPF